MYALVRITDGKYVAKGGSTFSYTYDIRYVKFFSTLEEAKQNMCPENETIIKISDL